MNHIDGEINDKLIDVSNNSLDIYSRKYVRDVIKLSTWLDNPHSEEELRNLFINMDAAMKYIHDRGYCIKSFNPDKIEILNNSLQQIKYNTVLLMPNNYSDRRELVKEDIYSSVFLQIAAYVNRSAHQYSNRSITKFINTLNPMFLKNNFESFEMFLPEKDIRYYRSIIKEGKSVYLNDYVQEVQKRSLNQLSEDYDSGNSNQNSKKLVKTNGNAVDFSDQNSQINNSIYSQLNNGDAAFINMLAFPIIVAVVGLVLMTIALVLSII